MKHTRTYSLLLGTISFFATTFNAQSNFKELERSSVIINRGIELHGDKKYEEAITEFKKVHRNDSNYYLASVEILNSYLALKKNNEGIALCDELLKLKNDYTPNILIYKGDFLDHMEKYGEAEKIYEMGAKEYPINHVFYYAMGVSKLHQKKPDQAYTYFIKTLKLNPFHSASHLQLGLLARRNNSIVGTMLAYQFSLLCDASSKRAQGIVGDLEKISKLELEPDTILSMKVFETENDFTELESIIKSKVALGSKYKSKTDLQFDLVKQMQLLIENIGKYKDVKGFYNEFYGAFFTELNNSKFLEQFIYFSLRGMEVEKVNKWLAKNKADVDVFETWCYNYMCKTLANYPENLNGKIVTVPHWFQQNLIVAAGVQNAEKNNEGYWVYYYKNGIKKAEGEFVNGKKNKVWKYYTQTGATKEETEFSNGAEKLYKSFYENSNPSVEVAIADNKITGVKKAYFSNGNIASSTEYKNGEISGTETHYYRNGSLRYSIKNEKKVINGDLVEYFDNGRIYQKVSFVNDNREGASKTFFNNANNTVASEGVYKKNKAIGEWKTYYRGGSIYKQMTYNEDGFYDGTVKEFHENGKIKTEEVYSAGKLNGLTKEFTDDGSLWQEFAYKKGKLLEYRAFKKDGTKICDNKINGKNFQLVLYHPNGNKRREGKVSDGELDGIWKDYSSFGVLTREANYKEGRFDGKYLEYHTNGKVRKERLYKEGTEDGYYKSFYLDGTLETEGMIVEGESQGYWKNYYKNGSLESNTYYLNDDMFGWNEYFDVNAKLSSENLYRENCLVKIVYHDTTGSVSQNIDLPGGTGLIERKTMDGVVIFKKQYVKDYAEGTSKSFYPDGKTETEVEYKKGKREGKAFAFNPLGGQISEIGYFNNEKNGKELVYFDNGKVQSEYYYENGNINGKCFFYFQSGKIFKDINYDYGDTEGESNVYDESGELIYTRNFHNDLLMSYTYKDTKGQLLKPMEMPTGDKTVICYYPNGKKSFEANYTNGDLNGKRILYHSNGKLMEDTEFYFDVQNGVSKEYYSNGNLRILQNYSYNRLEGKSENYYENGTLRSEQNYKNGVEHGWFKYYDANGKLVKSVLYYNGDPIVIK
ncbi:hypothetical protein CNR22_09235 [Sphingobacteriaceae bacterium]|nr:hypothetical protein CNR22_09235 [Sphingobacteriaceae bacterium]